MNIEEVLESLSKTFFKSGLEGIRDLIKDKGAQAFEDLVQRYLHITLD